MIDDIPLTPTLDPLDPLDAPGPIMLPEVFDNALMGFAHNDDAVNAVYSIHRVLSILMAEEDMSPEEALEWFDFNIEGAYLGANSPLFVDEELTWDE